MNEVCVHHCPLLQLRSISEEKGVCLAAPVNCQKYRQQPATVESNRHACEVFLHELFDIDHIASYVDLVDLIQAIHTDDKNKINAHLQQVFPSVDWIQLDDVGIGSDWSGVKVAIVCALTHPQLRATVGLIIGHNSATLTLGSIEHLDISLMGPTIKQLRSKEWPPLMGQRRFWDSGHKPAEPHLCQTATT